MDHSPCKVGLVLVPGFSHLGLALVTEPMFIANWLARARLFEWTTLSADGLAVPSSSGLSLPVAFPLTAQTAFDIALVVASFDSRAASTDARIGQWLKRAARAGVATGGVETGSEILAAAGLLDGIEVPIHWYNIDGARERSPGECPVFCVWLIGSMLPERSKDDDDFQRTAGRIAEGLQAA